MQRALEELQAVRKYEIYQAEYEDDLENNSVTKPDTTLETKQPEEMPD